MRRLYLETILEIEGRSADHGQFIIPRKLTQVLKQESGIAPLEPSMKLNRRQDLTVRQSPRPSDLLARPWRGRGGVLVV